MKYLYRVTALLFSLSLIASQTLLFCSSESCNPLSSTFFENFTEITGAKTYSIEYLTETKWFPNLSYKKHDTEHLILSIHPTVLDRLNKSSSDVQRLAVCHLRYTQVRRLEHFFKYAIGAICATMGLGVMICPLTAIPFVVFLAEVVRSLGYAKVVYGIGGAAGGVISLGGLIALAVGAVRMRGDAWPDADKLRTFIDSEISVEPVFTPEKFKAYLSVLNPTLDESDMQRLRAYTQAYNSRHSPVQQVESYHVHNYSYYQQNV